MARHTVHFPTITAITAILAVGCPVTAVAQSAARQSYHMPAQPLAQSLQGVARRSGVDVLAPDALVAGRDAPPLTGSYTVSEAVDRLLDEHILVPQ